MSLLVVVSSTGRLDAHGTLTFRPKEIAEIDGKKLCCQHLFWPFLLHFMIRTELCLSTKLLAPSVMMNMIETNRSKTCLTFCFCFRNQ